MNNEKLKPNTGLTRIRSYVKSAMKRAETDTISNIGIKRSTANTSFALAA